MTGAFEARDGWVFVTWRPSGVDAGYTGIGRRNIFPASELRHWTAAARAYLAKDVQTDTTDRNPHRLGFGGDQFIVDSFRSPKERRWQLEFNGCGVTSETGSPTDVLNILNLLDSAATIAMRQTYQLPTLRTPYYASQLACAAQADVPSGPRPLMPVGSSFHAHSFGIRLVVDTLGEVEVGSVRILGGDVPQVRTIVQSWKFHPATWDGEPVRQIVDTVVELPARVSDPNAKTPILTPETDGWLRVTSSILNGAVRPRDWVTPDRVDAWVAALEKAERASTVKDTTFVAHEELGRGNRVVGEYIVNKGVVRPQAYVSGCALPPFLDRLPPFTKAERDRYTEAARATRALRATPAELLSGPYESDDVACRASLPWIYMPASKSWEYPTLAPPGDLPGSMTHVELLASFVVDTAGIANPATLQVIDGSSDAAVAALRDGISTLRFRPATRAGMRVAQRMIRTMIVEAPAQCLVRDANAGCLRAQEPGNAAHPPRRIAVAMSSGYMDGTFEARDGWVFFSWLPSRPDDGYNGTGQHVILAPDEVHRWADTVRMLVALPPASQVNGLNPRLRSLGVGRVQIRLFSYPAGTNGERRDWTLQFQGCGPGAGGGSGSAADVLEFVSLLDSTAAIAARQQMQRPTLREPYYSNQLSCAARPVESPGPRQLLPAGSRLSGTQYGVRFVVDTSGRVESGSVRIIGGDVPRIRAAVERWTFQAAEWDGDPVRQIVDTIVELPDPARDTSVRMPVVTPQRDGWVRVTGSVVSGAQRVREWATPDTIDAWVSRLNAAERASKVRDTTFSVRIGLGPTNGIQFFAGYTVVKGTVTPAASLVGCANAFVEGSPFITPGDRTSFTEAAHRARTLRRIPADPSASVHESDDVACRVWLPWRRTGTSNVWAYPSLAFPGEAPGSMAHAEVLASFVVDSAGIANPRTLRAAEGQSDAAVAALRDALSTLRFRPATRGGARVAQRVIRTIIVEASPMCIARDSSPKCPRAYAPH